MEWAGLGPVGEKPSDIPRNVATAMGLAAPLAALVPGVGTAVSAGMGLASAGLHAVADVDDEEDV